jgi:hypothetical protein
LALFQVLAQIWQIRKAILSRAKVTIARSILKPPKERFAKIPVFHWKSRDYASDAGIPMKDDSAI